MVGGERGIMRNAAKVRGDERQLAADRVEAMDMRYGGETLDSLGTRFEQAAQAGNSEDATALASVMARRYGAGGVNRVARYLRNNVNEDNENNRELVGSLRQNLTDDSNFGNLMKNKAGDQFDMLSNGGMLNGQFGARAFTENMGGENSIVTSDADFASQSTRTLEDWLNSGPMTPQKIDRMRSLLTSDDQAVIAAFQGDPGKRQLFEQAYADATHDDSLSRAAQQEHQQKLDDAIIKIGNAAEQMSNSAGSLGNAAGQVATSAGSLGNAAGQVVNSTSGPSISIPHNTQQPTRSTPPPRPETNIGGADGVDFVSE